jgi:MFS family permease
MMLLLQPIKEDLQLTDTQLGFLTGIAFGLFYATLGLPIARWADRGNRVTITSLSIGLWGLTVMCCMLVSNYVQLVFARIAAAVGESGCKAPTYSLLGDYFPESAARTRAMSVYWLGSPLSALVSFVVGGWLNELYGWRATFFIMGVPGLLLAVVVKLRLHEPRLGSVSADARHPLLPPMKQVLLTLWSQRSCRHLSMALILLYTIGFGLAPWYAAFMMRSHEMRTGELGTWLGSILGLGGMAGILLGGYVSARWFPNNERGQMRASAVAVGSLVPCYIAFLTVPSKYQALAALVPLIMVFNFFFAPTYALLQRLVADEMRATTLAVLMLLANLIGMGLGPQVVGALSDALTPLFGADGLRYAMLTMSFVSLWAGYHFWMVGRTVQQDLMRAAQRASQASNVPAPSGAFFETASSK